MNVPIELVPEMKKVAIENDPRTKPLQSVFLPNVPKGFVREIKKVDPKITRERYLFSKNNFLGCNREFDL